MPRTKAASLTEVIDTVYDANGPCRVYITGADEQDKNGRNLWRVYFAVEGGRKRQMINTAPLRWVEAARLADQLNRRAGLLPEPVAETAEAVA